MPDPRPDEMRATRDRLLGAADRFAAGSADSLTKLQRLANNWPSGGESGAALQRMIERVADQDREHLARMRDLAHHLPMRDHEDTTPDDLTPTRKPSP